MAAFARWTNLSETTFLLRPTDAGRRLPAADLDPGRRAAVRRPPDARQRRTPGSRPAAYRPARTWCRSAAPGWSRIRRTATGCAFAAPPLMRSGPVAEDDLARIARRAAHRRRRDRRQRRGSTTAPAGSASCSATPTAVLGLQPDCARVRRPQDRRRRPLRRAGASDAEIEVRAFCPGYGMPEDPVTGSLNAGLAQWLAGSAPARVVRRRAGHRARPARPGARRDRAPTARSGWVATRATTVRRHRAPARLRRLGSRRAAPTSTSSSASSTRASRSPTAPAPAPVASSATRCASTSPRASRW